VTETIGSRRQRLVSMGLASLAVAVLAAVTYQPDDSASSAAPVTAVDEGSEAVTIPIAELAGEFLISGSSTVFPIVQLQAERFAQEASSVAISVEGPGSGDGAQKFCNGEALIANASRLYKDSEIELCEANGIEFIELRLAVDGITVITSPENDVLECLSFNDLYALTSGEAQGFQTWSDANALTSLWSGTTFADGFELSVYGPGEESGTFDSFAEVVIDSVAKGKTGLDVDAREFSREIRPDYISSPDDNTILSGIGSQQYSLGWVGFAYASQAAAAGQAKLVSISFDDGGSCVDPTPTTISSATFPIARFLYTYVNLEAVETNPALAAFVDYMLSEEGLTAVEEVGYIPLSEEDLSRTRLIWKVGLNGTGQWSSE
jgi:phosphate transport system substrate-binding protein